MKGKTILWAFALLLLLLPTGCDIGGGVQKALDNLHNAEYQDGTFENNLDSARAYLLEQLREKYGKEFTVVGDEDLENYGPFAGATYTCKAAPADAPEQIITALVSQTKYRNVRDDYAVYFFKEEAEAPVFALCEKKDYVIDHRVSLEMPETEHTWTADDGLKKFLLESGAYVRVTLYLEDDLDTGTYAEQILDFLSGIDQLGCNLSIQARANETTIFFSEPKVLDGFDINNFSPEEIEKMVVRRLKTGDPK